MTNRTKIKNIWKAVEKELPYDAKKDEENGLETNRDYCFVLWEWVYPEGRTNKLILHLEPIKYYGGEFDLYGNSSNFNVDWKRVRYWCLVEDMESYLCERLGKKLSEDILHG